MQTLFGTDGIRTRFGTTPLTPIDLIQLGHAIAQWSQETVAAAGVETHRVVTPRILIGHDTRESAALMKAALKTGLLQHNVELFDAGVIPTPALFYLVTKTDSYDFGIMLTASHNPYQDNGIKIFTHDGGKLSADQELTITQLFYEQIHPAQFDQLGTDTPAPTALTIYYNALKAQFPENFLHDINVALDCAHGAYSSTAPAFLESLGATVTTLAAEPNGKNINAACGSLHPEKLQKTVLTNAYSAGFAFDGDGDRLCAITQTGSVTDGDDLISFLMSHPSYQASTVVVGTIMSNQGLEAFVKKQNKQFYRTPVGDKLVIQKMKTTDSLIGGEPSGHVILKDFSETADALFVLLRCLETAILTGDWSFSSFTKFPQVLINTPVARKNDLIQSPYADIIAAQETSLTDGRIVVRYSGTESLLRVMVEASTQEQAESIGATLSQALSQALAQEQAESIIGTTLSQTLPQEQAKSIGATLSQSPSQGLTQEQAGSIRATLSQAITQEHI